MEALKNRGYTTFEKLDAGGQANVYKTVKKGKLFAIKVVHVEEPDQDKLDNDLKRELQIVRNLKHPNCIHVEELLRTKNKIYIVMDFMANGNIGSMVKDRGPLCEWNAKLWFCPVGRALRYLHKHNIAHRDLKLDNVLLDTHLNPILTDFGFSRFVSVESGKPDLSDTFCGTTSFNPPEILQQTPYNPFSGDMWSMGVMLFIMLNQAYPFDRCDMKKMQYKQMHRGYKLQDFIEARISCHAKEVIDKLLDPVPESRLTIYQLCDHGWFPVAFSEPEIRMLQDQKTSP